MNRIPVSSSNIASVGYENGTLEIEFNDGSIYHYFNVPVSIYSGLLTASSKGSYFHSYVRETYRYQKVR